MAGHKSNRTGRAGSATDTSVSSSTTPRSPFVFDPPPVMGNSRMGATVGLADLEAGGKYQKPQRGGNGELQSPSDTPGAHYDYLGATKPVGAGGFNPNSSASASGTFNPGGSGSGHTPPKVSMFDLGSELANADQRERRALQRCTISWQHISYVIPPQRRVLPRMFSRERERSDVAAILEQRKQRQILNNISGRSGAGELTAIIGPSGAGKTTLLDILADRVRSTGGRSAVRVEGVVEVNGQPRDPRTFQALMNYVSQDMSFFGSFSVLETLQFAAGLSLPAHVPLLTRESRVQDVLDAMGLRSCARVLVGDVFHKGISSGQLKRLSIAVELLSDPALLLLDEPTSGLDASSARSVMQHIERLCHEGGKNVVCTIHQPSSSVYDMLTNLVILSNGQLIYSGPTSAALAHFFSMGYVCPMYSNPAEYFVHLVNTDFQDEHKLEPFVRALEDSAEPQRLRVAMAQDRARQGQVINRELLRIMRPSKRDQFGVLLMRNLRHNWRNPGVFWLRVFMYLLLSLMVGTMYLSSDKVITSTAMVPLLFYVQAFLVFMSVAAMPALLEQRAVLEREMRSHGLHLVSYALANILAALPGIAVISLVASVIVVFLAHVNSFASFFLNLTLSLITAESMIHLLGAAVPHYIMGIALGAGIFGMFMLCEGFMVPFESIPVYWRWGYYLAFHTYSFESFMYEHFSQDDSPDAWDLLEYYGMSNVNVRKNMLILVGYAVVLQILVVLVLNLRFQKHRRH